MRPWTTAHTDFVDSVAFGTTADGRLLLATGSQDRSVRVWDPLTGTPVGQPLTGHTGTVASVALGTTADGRLLLASGARSGCSARMSFREGSPNDIAPPAPWLGGAATWPASSTTTAGS